VGSGRGCDLQNLRKSSSICWTSLQNFFFISRVLSRTKHATMQARGAWLKLLSLALFVGLCASADEKLPKNAKNVVIGMDCGSSGSRICIYYFDKVPFDEIWNKCESSEWPPALHSLSCGARFYHVRKTDEVCRFLWLLLVAMT
jgi:hypothetical protein